MSTIPAHEKINLRFVAFCDNPDCDRVDKSIDGRTRKTALINFFNALAPERDKIA